MFLLTIALTNFFSNPYGMGRLFFAVFHIISFKRKFEEASFGSKKSTVGFYITVPTDSGNTLHWIPRGGSSKETFVQSESCWVSLSSKWETHISKQKEGPEWQRMHNIQRCEVPFSFKMTYVSWVIMNFCRARLCPFWSILSPRPRTRVSSGGCTIYALHKAWSMDESATVFLFLAPWTKSPRLPFSTLIHPIQVGGSSA